jgi:hypothetical protein
VITHGLDVIRQKICVTVGFWGCRLQQTGALAVVRDNSTRLGFD